MANYCTYCGDAANFREATPEALAFCNVLCQAKYGDAFIAVRVITWNIAEISKSVVEWLDELNKHPDWDLITKKDDYDILCVTIQEDTAAGNFGKALKIIFKNYEIAEYSNGPPGKVVRTLVFYKTSEIQVDTVEKKAACLQRKVAFCTKSTVGVSMETYSGIQLVFMGSHFPVDVKNKKDLGLDKRNKAEIESIKSVLGPILSKKRNAVFWAGDLNYRVIQNKDQLDQERTRGGAFSEFQEAPRKFFPTCKLHRDCDRAKSDTDNVPTCYVDNRNPSFCDRILFKSENVKVTNTRYMSYADPEAVQESDHNLVYGDFLIYLH